MFGDLDKVIEERTEALNKLDVAAETRDLTTAEDNLRRALTIELWQKKRLKESLIVQKSRFQWLKDGDTNSHFFHKCIHGWRASNGINGLKIDGVWVHEPNQVKKAIEDHFKQAFSEPWNNRPFPNS